MTTGFCNRREFRLIQFVILLLTATAFFGDAWILYRKDTTRSTTKKNRTVLQSSSGSTRNTNNSDNNNNDDASLLSPPPPVRVRQKLRSDNGRKVGVISRTVSITDDWSITIWEWEKPSTVVQRYWEASSSTGAESLSSSSRRLLDPFGLICWPGSVAAAQELWERRNEVFATTAAATRVLVLGGGTGIEAQAAAVLGAERVLATDNNPATLNLLRHGAKMADLDDIITCEHFDLFSDEKLPPGYDVVVVSDVLYNEQLADQVARRCYEARRRSSRDGEPAPSILLSDSQNFVPGFLPKLNQMLKTIPNEKHDHEWNERRLNSFTGSSVMVDEDQTYDVKVRVLWIA